jgi:hypothetical protein
LQHDKEFIVDPNDQGLVKSLGGVSKVELERAKKETQRARQELKALGAGRLIVHPDAPWLRAWDFVQAMTITYLFVGAALPAHVSVLASRLVGCGQTT